MPKRKFINLLPQEEFDASTTGRLLKWATSSFRYIVIFTELVVMTAFLSRFYFDAKNSDLNELINVKKAQITSFAENETVFRKLQDKISVLKGLEKNIHFADQLNKITSRVPDGVYFQTLSVNKDTILIKGSSASELSIAQFITNLKSIKDFKRVDLGQLGSAENGDTSMLFNIKIEY